MSRINLRLDDYMILAIYPGGTRREAADRIREVRPFLQDDPEMADLLGDVLKKLAVMTDEEYRQLDLSPFWQEPVNYDEEDEADEQSLLCGG